MIGMMAGGLSRHRENGAVTLNDVNNMSVHASLTLQARGQFILSRMPHLHAPAQILDLVIYLGQRIDMISFCL